MEGNINFNELKFVESINISNFRREAKWKKKLQDKKIE